VITINERTGMEIEARFFDADDAPTAPTTVHWQLICDTTNQTVQDWTLVASTQEVDEFGQITGVRVDIQIPGPLNAIQKNGNRKELKRLIVAANKDEAGEYSEEYAYYVRNLPGRI